MAIRKVVPLNCSENLLIQFQRRNLSTFCKKSCGGCNELTSTTPIITTGNDIELKNITTSSLQSSRVDIIIGPTTLNVIYPKNNPSLSNIIIVLIVAGSIFLFVSISYLLIKTLRRNRTTAEQ